MLIDESDPVFAMTFSQVNRRAQAMIRRLMIVAVCVIAFAAFNQAETASAQNKAFGSTWGQQSSGGGGSGNLARFYHYPYVTYPQNYWGNEYYRSADSLYHRYPPEMRIPVNNRHWHNYYPSPRRYHFGHHFLTDVF